MVNLKNTNLIKVPEITIPNTPAPPKEILPEEDLTCMELWDKGAKAGLEKLYLNRIAEEHRQTLGKLFLLEKGKRYLDAGCGAGSMFEITSRQIQPAEVCAIDWSEIMLEKGKKEATRTQKLYPKTSFRFPTTNNTKPAGWVDLTKSLPFSDNFFDGCISNQVVCYLVCGWRKPIEEISRVIKPNGYLYLGTLLDNWGFTKVLWKHFLPEFLHAPVVSLRGLKCRRILDEVSKEARKHGAQYPPRKELIDYLKTLGFKEIREVPTYWGGSVALRAKLTAKPPF